MLSAPAQRPRETDDTPVAAGDAPRPRKRVLVSAYAISPYHGSEPGVGWHVCSRLAKYHDITVLCTPGLGHDTFRDDLAKHARENGPIDGMTVHFVEPPPLSKLCQRENSIMRRTMYYTGYAAWQRAAFAEARKLHNERPFDLIHQLNITGYREPGYLWKLNAPFVWGPVGGGSNFPAGYSNLLGARDRFFYTLRNLTNGLQKHTLRRSRAAAAKASHIWAISEDDRRMIQDAWQRDAEPLIETGATPHPNAKVRDYDGSRPLRLVWSGLHIGRKALPILLRALAVLKGKLTVEVAILGAGAETEAWKTLATQLGVASSLRWLGQIPRDQALAEMNAADALAFTSVLEGTPHVVLESMSLGLPVICHNACGMGVAVTDACGMKIDMVNATASVSAFANAIQTLAANPARLRQLSQAAIARANELSWDSKAATFAAKYDEVLKNAEV